MQMVRKNNPAIDDKGMGLFHVINHAVQSFKAFFLRQNLLTLIGDDGEEIRSPRSSRSSVVRHSKYVVGRAHPTGYQSKIDPRSRQRSIQRRKGFENPPTPFSQGNISKVQGRVGIAHRKLAGSARPTGYLKQHNGFGKPIPKEPILHPETGKFHRKLPFGPFCKNKKFSSRENLTIWQDTI